MAGSNTFRDGYILRNRLGHTDVLAVRYALINTIRMGKCFAGGLHSGRTLGNTMTCANGLSGGSTVGLTDTFSNRIADGLTDGVRYRRRNTASDSIGYRIRLGIGMVPSFGSTEVGHIHHRDGQAEIHACTSLQLLVPTCHLTSCLTEPSFQVLCLYRTRDNLKNILSVRHTGDVFFRGVLRISINVLTAHALITNINTTGLSLRNAANNCHTIHRIHLFVKPF